MARQELASIGEHVVDFVGRLYGLPTARYALNHSQMEAWVALEGLEFFTSRGWKCTETLGFITGRTVRGKRGVGIKFPDLVCVDGDVVLWWEFKAIGRRVLHPKSGGGTFLHDIHAMLEFKQKHTLDYHREGTLGGARGRSDRVTIEASGLREKIAGAKRHVGVAMLFVPGEASIPCAKGDWCPAEKAREIGDGVLKIREGSGIEPLSKELAVVGSRAGVGLPACHGWLVPMGGDGGARAVRTPVHM